MPTSSQMLLFALSRGRRDTSDDKERQDEVNEDMNASKLTRTRSLRLPRNKDKCVTSDGKGVNGVNRGSLLRYGSFRWSRPSTSTSSSVTCESPSNLNAVNNQSNNQSPTNSKLAEDNEKLVRKVAELELKIKEFEADQKETKESIEFLTSERLILCETLKETEETLAKERSERSEERKYIEELCLRTQKLYNKVVDKSEKIKQLNLLVSEKESVCESLNDYKSKTEVIIDNLVAEWSKLRNGVCVTLNVPFNDLECINIETTVDEISAFDSFLTKHFKPKLLEAETLKEDITKLVTENYKINIELRSCSDKLKRFEEKNAELKKSLEHHEETIKTLREQLEASSEEKRCTQAVNKELEKQLKDVCNGNDAIYESLELSRELEKCKETLRVKEDLFEKLVAKYNRNRKVWEDNERTANEEIKKLDELIDSVVAALKANASLVNDCVPLQQLLQQLTQES